MLLYISGLTLISSLFSRKFFPRVANSIRNFATTEMMQKSSGIPSLPGSMMTDFGRALKTSINDILTPIQEEAAVQEELRDTVYREVRLQIFVSVDEFLKISQNKHFNRPLFNILLSDQISAEKQRPDFLLS